MDRPRCHRRRPGFTLVELLVVVAVIALLIAALLPALGGAQDAARGMVSLSRMGQIGVGWAIYAVENDDVSVAGQPGRAATLRANLYDVGNGRHYRPRWFASIGAAAGFYAYRTPSEDPADEHSLPIDNEVFLCPVVPDWVSTRNAPYGYNYQFLGNTRFVGDDESRGFINFPVRVSSLKSTSATVCFASSMGTAAGKPEAIRTPNRTDGSRDPGLLALGGHGYALDPPRLTPDGDFADRRHRSPEHRSAPDARYRGRANVAFCDGHAAPRSLADLGYVVGDDGAVLADDPGASNGLFSGDRSDATARPVTP